MLVVILYILINYNVVFFILFYYNNIIKYYSNFEGNELFFYFIIENIDVLKDI